MHYTGTIWRPPYEAASLLLEVTIQKYFPSVKSIGSFARITDIGLKLDVELLQLKSAGFDGLTIGMETADEAALQFMNKGYGQNDILVQCGRLGQAGISYKFFYLVGISGKDRGVEGAKMTAKVCNRLHPKLIGANMLTIYPDSELYREVRKGSWQPESELEKYMEMRMLIEHLAIEAEFAALGASNAVQLQGVLPKDKKRLLAVLDEVICGVDEKELEHYRNNLRHL